MSGTRFLLDTNVAIGVLSRSSKAAEIAGRFGIETGGNAVSQITRIELLGFPALTEEDDANIRAFLGDCAVLIIDAAVDAKTIDLRRSTKLKLPDAILAATALVHGLRLVTLDQRLEQIFQDQDQK